MFKNYLNPEHHSTNPHGVSPGSSRRSYFYGDPDHQLSHHQTPCNITIRNDEESSTSSGERHCSKNWIWVGIAIVYLVAIGIIVAVLLLAPKYPSVYYNETQDQGPPPRFVQPSNTEKHGPFVLVAIDQGIPDPEYLKPFPQAFEQPHKHLRDSQNEFIPSPRDEVILFNINPRRRDSLVEFIPISDG